MKKEYFVEAYLPIAETSPPTPEAANYVRLNRPQASADACLGLAFSLLRLGSDYRIVEVSTGAGGSFQSEIEVAARKVSDPQPAPEPTSE